MSFKPYTEDLENIWNLFDFRSDPNPEPDQDPLSWKRIRIKMKRIRNTDGNHKNIFLVNRFFSPR